MLSINSFPRWVLYLIVGTTTPGIGVRRRVLLSLRVSFLLLRRKIGGIDHRRLLQLLQLLALAFLHGRVKHKQKLTGALNKHYFSAAQIVR